MKSNDNHDRTKAAMTVRRYENHDPANAALTLHTYDTQARSATVLAKADLTVPEYVRSFLNAHEQAWSAPTMVGLNAAYDHIESGFSGVRLCDVDSRMVRRWLLSMADCGLGSSCIAKAFRLLKMALDCAVNDGLIPFSPCQVVKPPKRGAYGAKQPRSKCPKRSNEGRPNLSVQEEEREELLDRLSVCATFLREEAAQVSQCFDEACAALPEDLQHAQPVPDVKAMEQIGLFLWGLHCLGVDGSGELAQLTGLPAALCRRVCLDPLHADPEERGRVVAALEEVKGEELWETPSGDGSLSVGELLYRWLRENFETPYQFSGDATRFDVGCRLYGATNELQQWELVALTHADTATVLKRAADVSARENGLYPYCGTVVPRS